jgi:hypothetical protein
MLKITPPTSPNGVSFGRPAATRGPSTKHLMLAYMRGGGDLIFFILPHITSYYLILLYITLLYLVMLKNYVNMVSYSKFRICYMVYIFLSLYLMALEGGHLKMFSFFLLG